MTTAWYLKKTDGAIYGPVPLSDLQDWAMDGRVAPDDLLSKDRAEWIPAPRLPALAMTCIIHYDGGAVYGPVHHRALADLIEEGDVRPDQMVEDRAAGVTQPASMVVLNAAKQPAPAAAPSPELEQAVAALKAERDELAAKVVKLGQSLEAKTTELSNRGNQAETETKAASERESQLTAKFAALESERDELTAKVEELVQSLDAKSADAKVASERESELKDKLEALESDLAKSETRATDLEKQIAEAAPGIEAERSTLNERITALESERDDLKGQVTSGTETLQTECDKLKADLRSLNESHGVALKQVRDEASDAARRIVELEEALDTARKTITELEAASDVESAVAEHTKSLQSELDQERERNRKKETALQQRLSQLEGDLQEKLAGMVRAKQAVPADADAEPEAANTVVRAALARARTGALTPSAKLHAPCPIAQRTAMIRKAAGPVRPQPKHRAAPQTRKPGGL